MKMRHSGRKGRLYHKFQEMSPGSELRVGIPRNASSDIYAAAAMLGILVTVMKTEESVTREDGLTVPVYLVSFR